ncbi:MAG: hypothetical protein HYW81_00760 [Parcubacteria group bacterium]|nr:hypothetical protein [Parcubacteria group bacterium]
MEGALVILTGELVEKKGTSWFIDDGSGEAKITFQPTAALQKPAAKTGDWLEVVGLVGETSSGYRILPRYQEDIKLLDATEIFELAEPQILGVEAEPIDGISRSGLRNWKKSTKDEYRRCVRTRAAPRYQAYTAQWCPR